MPIINLSQKQNEFLFESNAFINIAEGSVRAGKSHVLLIRFMNELRHGPEGEYVVTGKSTATCDRNIVTPIRNIIGDALSYNQAKGYFYLFNKKVYVIGANDERAISKIKGATFAGALVDEITELPESYWSMLLSRLSLKDAKLFGGTNPDSPYHWLKVNYIDRFKNDSSNYFKNFKFTLEDNPSLDEQYKSNLKKSYQGLWYKRYILGDWVLAEGAVFDFFDRQIHVTSGPSTYAKHYFLGIDYGTTNPFAAVLIGYNDDHKPELWVEKEFYWDSKEMGFQKTNADYGYDLERVFGDYPLRMVYIDPSAASFQTELKRLKWPVKPANNDVLEGIQSIATLLSQGSLVITENCPNLIKEMEGYVWDTKAIKRGIDKPIKARDHAIDAMRYPIYTFFGGKTNLKESTHDSRAKQVWNQNPHMNDGFGAGQMGWQRY